jgi:hypothetical protein
MTHRTSRLSRRAKWIAGGVCVLLAGGITALATLSTTKPGPAPSVTTAGASPNAQARAACLNMAGVQQLVRANANEVQVFDYLDPAETEIAAAAQADSVWLSLQSGIDSLAQGLRNDQAGPAQLGIAIVRDQCRRTGVQLARFPSPQPGEPGS